MKGASSHLIVFSFSLKLNERQLFMTNVQVSDSLIKDSTF